MKVKYIIPLIHKPFTIRSPICVLYDSDKDGEVSLYKRTALMKRQVASVEPQGDRMIINLE